MPFSYRKVNLLYGNGFQPLILNEKENSSESNLFLNCPVSQAEV